MQININTNKLNRAELLDFAAYIFSMRNPYLFRSYCFPMISALEAVHITKGELDQLEEKAYSFIDKKDSASRNHTQEQILITQIGRAHV